LYIDVPAGIVLKKQPYCRRNEPLDDDDDDDDRCSWDNKKESRTDSVLTRKHTAPSSKSGKP